MASFPGAIYPVPSFGTNMSDAKTHTTWRDEITDEVRAIELELGTNPSGSSATVGARIGTMLPLAGGTLTGNLNGTTATFTGQVSGITPTAAAHLSRKDYVDTKVADTGDTMTGQLNINAAAGANPLILRNSTDAPSVRFLSVAGTEMGAVICTSSAMTVQTLNDNTVSVNAPANVVNESGASSRALTLRAATESPELGLASTAGTTLLALQATSALATINATLGDLELRTGGTTALTVDAASQNLETAASLTIAGNLDHNGSLVGLYGTSPVARNTGWTTFTNLSVDKTCDANTVAVAELADIVGTLIEALKATGIIGA